MSSSQKTIPAHTHCKICGKSIPLGREFCSNECRETDVKAQARSKRMTRIYTLFFVILMVVIMLFSFLGR